jgi:hypothetical protein
MKEITKQQLVELLKERRIKVSDIFEFVEYLDKISKDGIDYIVDGKNTIITYPVFWSEYKEDVFVYYNSYKEEGYVQIEDSIYKFKLKSLKKEGKI